ncbi:hypothetical protein BAY61_18795 [Prauserella marina]|uniref:Uncharacterized protein n=1 Tax=Prauserella marina TaxID=530584 RepID=A0A222VS26_9PSEU|nr:DUF6585 family protein [Prauserella marina]ASR36709.1 hypothetical protein BAY61_18795 [Prauserella marina]PWV80415.1 hypothetical protein DES30_103507 [Prauserella marina]SDD53813.1 hypothetical protein SAMN05421630_109292 [Prauserella marina]
MTGSGVHYESIDQAARHLRMGKRRSVFRPISRSKGRRAAGLIPVFVLFAFVLVLFGSAGLLTSFLGIVVVGVFVLMICAAMAGMTITARDAKGDQELHVFDEGAVIRGPKGRVLPYRWDETQLIRRGVKPAGASDSVARWSYGLVHPVTPPVVLGQTVITAKVIANSEGADLGNLMRVAEFERLDVWGREFEDGILRAHLPWALQELAEGHAVEFGPATALPQGLTFGGGKVMAWDDISALRIEGGFLRVKVRGKFFTSSVQASDVPNFVVLAAVVDRLSAARLR